MYHTPIRNVDGNKRAKVSLQFFSVALVHFSDQKSNSQNYLFNLHIILCISYKVSHSFEHVTISLVHS